MRAESSEWSGARRRLGPSARAARTSSRFVSDFEPGTDNVESSGPSATGACQAPVAAGVDVGEYPSVVIGS